jgi:hypothetical protein
MNSSAVCRPAAIEPSMMQERLATLLGTPERCWLQRIRVVRHKAGRRCVIEYALEIDGKPLELIGRIRAREFHRRAWRVNNTLWSQRFGCAAGVMVPEPVGAIESLQMWLQKKVEGRAATAALLTPGWGDLAIRVATAAAAVHTSTLNLRHRHTIDDELSILDERFARLSAAEPALSERLRLLFAECVRVGRSIDSAPVALIHRDFYPDHLSFDEERTWLLDLDLATIGDPALDIGNFIAHLTEQALREIGNPDALSDRQEAIIDAYSRLSPSSERRRIDAWAALSLARHVQLCTVVPRRAHLLPQLLELATARLSLVH